MSGLKTLNRQVIEDDIPYGCYLWEMPDGQGFVGDEEGRHFMMFAERGDQNAIKIMRDAVRSEFGITRGQAVFLAGHRPIDDEEYAEQKSRMKWGLQPDEHDLNETWEQMKKSGRRS